MLIHRLSHNPFGGQDGGVFLGGLPLTIGVHADCTVLALMMSGLVVVLEGQKSPKRVLRLASQCGCVFQRLSA